MVVYSHIGYILSMFIVPSFALILPQILFLVVKHYVSNKANKSHRSLSSVYSSKTPIIAYTNTLSDTFCLQLKRCCGNQRNRIAAIAVVAAAAAAIVVAEVVAATEQTQCQEPQQEDHPQCQCQEQHLDQDQD